MKKLFKSYLIIWAIFFVLFQVLAFAGGALAGGYTASFWVGYGFITLAFAGQLACGYFALKTDDRKKLFYNFSLLTVSRTGLILTFVFGGLCMFIPALPYWVGVIVCAILLAFSAVAVIKASTAVELVSEIDEKVKTQTLFLKSLTADAEGLINCAKSDSVREQCRKVYEAARYSDPMSHDALAALEGEITVKFAALTEAVTADDAARVDELATTVTILLADRERKCKLLK